MKNIKFYISGCLVIICLAFIPLTKQTLKEVFHKDFYVGAALSQSEINGEDRRGQDLVIQQFNSITPEDLLKWRYVHPGLNKYNFKNADEFVAFGQAHNMIIIGHTLVWHHMPPDYIFDDRSGKSVGRDIVLQRMQEHITTVVGRYKSKIQGWDVVNEAVEENGTLRRSKWLESVGPDYAVKAFEFAHLADPDAELYYNDYNLWKPAKREGVIKLVKDLQAHGVPVKAIGMQGHYSLTVPSIKEIEASIIAFSKLGVDVNITELDVDVLPRPGNDQSADAAERYAFEQKFNPYTAGLPDSIQQKLTQRYADIFALFHKHRDKISRVTFWGVTDATHWRNNSPIKGRINHPLLFDRNYLPKPAFQAVLEAVKTD